MLKIIAEIIFTILLSSCGDPNTIESVKPVPSIYPQHHAPMIEDTPQPGPFYLNVEDEE